MAQTLSVSGRYADAVEGELARWLDQRSPVGTHYDLLAYHMGWADGHLRRTPGPRGKRFRPLLCLLSCEAVGGTWSDALPIGAAIEFLHNFSLIHDDIEDHDEARHHRPSLWKLSGEPLAINAGDAMLALAGLAALSAQHVPDVAREFQETALALTEGQYLDMSFEARAYVSAGEYFDMIARKTGALITYACVSGARLGRGSPRQILGLRTFGHQFGLAFQIFDDIRGIWDTSERTGKVAGKDIVNRKKSLPVILALDAVADGPDHDRLSSYYGGVKEDSPDEIVAIFEHHGIREQVETHLQDHLGRAFAALEEADLTVPFAADLGRLADELVAL